MSKTEVIGLAIYSSHNPRLDIDIPDIMSWDAFMQEKVYSPMEYGYVKTILKSGRRWMMFSPQRTVFMLMSNTPVAEYMALAVRNSIALKTGKITI